MENFKGTPGKWYKVKVEKTEYMSERNEICYGDDGECVAEFVENDYDAQLIAHAPEMLEKHYGEIGILEDILKNNPIGDVAFKLRMIIESKKDLLTRATTI